MNELMYIGTKIIIKYNGDVVYFGQCYDGMTGFISGYIGNRYRITLDAKSRKKINEFNYRAKASWTIEPNIPFQYIYA